jgi:hypothetical protein
MTTATSRMRRAYLHAALDTRMAVLKEGAIARAYVGEKVDLAFKAEYEEDLLARLDLQRQQLYYKYYRESLGG